MRILFSALIYLNLVFGLLSCNSQTTPTYNSNSSSNKNIGGGCEGCELMFEGMPDSITSASISIGWVKAAEDGSYIIKTSRPGNYPDGKMAAHIHLSIKEKDLNEAYYADLYFDDDPLYDKHLSQYGKFDRAGNELLRVQIKDSVLFAEHNIILGMNIPNYPKK